MHNHWIKSVLLIFSREVRDQFRDRRTLFMIGVLPLLLYPLIGMSFMQLAQFMRRHPSKVLIVTEEPLIESPALVADGQFAGLSPRDASLIQLDIMQMELPSRQKAEFQATAMIAESQYDVVVCFPPRFKQRLRQVQQIDDPDTSSAEAPDDDWPSEPLLFYSTAKDRSRMAYDRVKLAIAVWRRELVHETLKHHEISPQATMPFVEQSHDVSPTQSRRAAIWSKILPFVLVIWAMTGAFYPAVDLCAGEKERGTLETLLCSPAERSEIVWGKMLTIMLFSVLTAILNLGCMSLTSSFIAGQFKTILQTDVSPILTSPPINAYVWLLIALIPIAALFSALSLALATMARSTKEGQYYLMPLILLTMPLLILPMLPSVELELGTAIIPVSGVLLLLKQLMEQEFHSAMLYATPVIVVTGICCWMATKWAIDQFNDESVLFRESERFSIAIWLRQLVSERMPTPTVAQAVLCGVVIILIRFFVGMSTPAPDSWSSFSTTVSVSLIALVLLPAMAMAILLTTRPTLTLLIRRTSFASMAAAALLAVCLHPMAVALLTLVRVVYPIDPAIWQPYEAILGQAPGGFALIFVMALLPAFCEEFAFRGFVLSGLRHLGHKWQAIVISAVMFGVAHGMLQQSIVASVFGVVLGYLAVTTGSIWPCMVFHAVHNTMGIVSANWLARLSSDVNNGWLVQSISVGGQQIPVYGPIVVLVFTLAAAVLLSWFRRLPMEQSNEEHLARVVGSSQATALEAS